MSGNKPLRVLAISLAVALGACSSGDDTVATGVFAPLDTQVHQGLSIKPGQAVVIRPVYLRGELVDQVSSIDEVSIVGGRNRDGEVVNAEIGVVALEPDEAAGGMELLGRDEAQDLLARKLPMPITPKQGQGLAVIVLATGHTEGVWRSDFVKIDYTKDGQHDSDQLRAAVGICVDAAAPLPDCNVGEPVWQTTGSHEESTVRVRPT